jgi:signal transduction histidine kinase
MNYQDLLYSPIISSKIVPLIEKASRSPVPILLLGEQGTGKELIAKIIHHTGGHRYLPFFKIDCKFLSENTFREELTRILREIREKGVPGTLFLREVGFLQEGSQLKLLELVEDGILSNGGREAGQSLRVISSSSEDLERKVAQGKFSEDLLERLNTLSLKVPSLRDRGEEISTIARYLLAQQARKMNLRKMSITSKALKMLEIYWWPGNLREFERVIVQSAIFSAGETLTDRDLFVELESEKNAFAGFLKKLEIPPPSRKTRSPSQEALGPPQPLFLIELVHRIKNPLVSIKTFTQLLREKFSDGEFREYFYRIVTEDIEKIDSVLDGLLSYIKINTPVRKTNTIHTILEETLKKYEKTFEQKRIKVFKKYETNLPETVVHDEQLRYIMNSILQYAQPSIAPEGTLGILTQCVDLEARSSEDRRWERKEGGWVEILILFTGYKKSVEQLEAALGVTPDQQAETIELE